MDNLENKHIIKIHKDAAGRTQIVSGKFVLLLTQNESVEWLLTHNNELITALNLANAIKNYHAEDCCVQYIIADTENNTNIITSKNHVFNCLNCNHSVGLDDYEDKSETFHCSQCATIFEQSESRQCKKCNEINTLIYHNEERNHYVVTCLACGHTEGI